MNTILARNLSPKGCNEANLNNYFSAIGPVSKIIVDTAARAARITFRDANDAEKALSHNGMWFIGAALRLELTPSQSMPTRKRSRSRSFSRSPKRRRSRSPARRISRSPRRRSPSPRDRRSRSRSRSFSPKRRRISRSRSPPQRDRRISRSRSRSRSPMLRSRSRSISPVRRDQAVCLTDLLEGTTEEIIRNAVVESMNTSAEPFDGNHIRTITVDNNNCMALVTFSDRRFATKLLQQNNLMLFSRLIPIQASHYWKGEVKNDRSRSSIKTFNISDRKALEALVDPATIQYITDVLKCSIDHDIYIEVRLKGQNEKLVVDAQQALQDTIAQRFSPFRVWT